MLLCFHASDFYGGQTTSQEIYVGPSALWLKYPLPILLPKIAEILKMISIGYQWFLKFEPGWNLYLANLWNNPRTFSILWEANGQNCH